jgi:hypothetical protein
MSLIYFLFYQIIRDPSYKIFLAYTSQFSHSYSGAHPSTGKKL